MIVFGLLNMALIWLSVLFIFLFTYKRPRPAGLDHYPEPAEPAWISTLSASAQAVHRKERSKQTAKKFTLFWFKEYLSGQRSAFAAWLTWLIILPVLLALSMIISIVLFELSPSPALYSLFRFIIFSCEITAMYILWVCAENSTPFFKYFCRIIASLSAVLLVSYAVMGIL